MIKAKNIEIDPKKVRFILYNPKSSIDMKEI
jgi:hypothetical protein